MCSTDRADGVGLLETAAAALRAFESVALDGSVADVELTGWTQRLEALGRIVAGQKLRLVAEIDGRNASAGQHARTTEDLLAGALRISRGEAKAQTVLASQLAELPETAAALRDGRVGVGQAAETARKAGQVKDRDGGAALVAAIDRHAASAGQTMDRTRLARELDRFAEQRQPGVLKTREERAHERRGVWFGETPDGIPTIRGQLSVVGMAHVRAALDALGKFDGAKDDRSVAQRHHDALVALAEKALDTGELPTVAMQRPHVLLITTPDALHGVDGVEPSLLDGHGPVSPDTARQLCCDSHLTRVRVDGSGNILDVNTERPGPTLKQRIAVIGRDKHCVGCGAPITRCQIHHIHWRSKGGKTRTSNLVLVCWNCHTHIHHRGWTITQDPAGHYRAGPPAPDLQEQQHRHLENSIEQPDLRHTG